MFVGHILGADPKRDTSLRVAPHNLQASFSRSLLQVKIEKEIEKKKKKKSHSLYKKEKKISGLGKRTAPEQTCWSKRKGLSNFFQSLP